MLAQPPYQARVKKAVGLTATRYRLLVCLFSTSAKSRSSDQLMHGHDDEYDTYQEGCNKRGMRCLQNTTLAVLRIHWLFSSDSRSVSLLGRHIEVLAGDVTPGKSPTGFSEWFDDAEGVLLSVSIASPSVAEPLLKSALKEAALRGALFVELAGFGKAMAVSEGECR